MATDALPTTLYPGQTNDPVWEGILNRIWQQHVQRFGVGWDTGRTTDAERAAVLKQMQTEYAAAKTPGTLQNLSEADAYNYKHYQGNWANQNAGKLLGYIYDNTASKQYGTDVQPVWNETGEGGFYSYQPTAPAKTTYQAFSDSKPIPVYEPPIDFELNDRRLTDKEKFELAAGLAGAEDVSRYGKISAGTLDSNYVPLGLRSAVGLPMSFDMLRNIDPSRPDWNLQKAAVYNPTSKGFFGDILSDIAGMGPIVPIALMAAGVPPVYAGATMGGLGAAAGDGNILEGIAKGAATAALGQGLSTALPTGGIASLVEQATGLSGLPTAMIENAAKGAATAVLKGGDALEGALMGAASSGISGIASGLEGFADLDPALQKTLTSVATGAAKALVTGGNPLEGAVQNGIAALVSAAPQIAAGLESAVSAPAQGEEPSFDEMVAAMGEQDAQQAAFESALQAYEPTALESAIDAGYLGQEPVGLEQLLAAQKEAPAITLPEAAPSAPLAPADVATAAQEAGVSLTPEQTASLATSETEDTLLDTLKQMAESAVGAVVPSAEAAGQDKLVLSTPEATQGAQPKDYQAFFDVMRSDDPQLAYSNLPAEERAAVDRAGQEFQASSEERQSELYTQYRVGGLEDTLPLPASEEDIFAGLAQQEADQAQMQQALETAIPDQPQPAEVDRILDQIATTTDQDTADIQSLFQQQLADAKAEGKTSDEALQAALDQVSQQATQAQQSTTAQFEQLGTGLSDLGQQLQTQAQQEAADRAALEAALRGEYQTGFGSLSEQMQTQAQQEAADRAALEAALRGEYQTGFGSLEQQILSESEKQAAAQQAMQEALQQQFGAGVSDLEQQIIAQAAADEAERAKLEAALRELGTSTSQQIGQVQTGLGQQLGQLGSVLGQKITGLGQQQAAAQSALGQQVQAAQQQANLGMLFNLLGGMGQQQPQPVVQKSTPAEIKYFYDIGGKSIFAPTFSGSTPYAEGGTVQDLMRIMRG